MIRWCAAGAAALVLAASTVVVAATPTAVWHVRAGATGDCTQAAPCGSIDAAVRRAATGDEIWLHDGELRDQRVLDRPDAPTRSGAAVIRPAPGAAPVLAGITRVQAPWLTWSGVRIENGGIKFHAGADHNRLENATVKGNVGIVGGDHVSVVGTRILGVPDWDTLNIGWGSDHARVEGNVIGGAHDGALAGAAHVDCLQVFHGLTDLVIRGNTFHGCALSTMMLKSDFAPVDGLLIERNFIQDCGTSSAQCSAPFAIQLIEGTADGSPIVEPGTGLPFTNVTIRHNTIDGGIFLKTGHPVSLVGNIITGGTDDTTLVSAFDCAIHEVAWNLVDRVGSCALDETNLLGVPRFVDRLSVDLHLAPGSPGIDVGSPHAPELDIDGETTCGAADLGADEACPPPLPPAPSDPDVVGEWSFGSAEGWRFEGGAGVRDGALRVVGDGRAHIESPAVLDVLRSGQFAVELWVEPAASVAPEPGAIVAAGVAGRDAGFLIGQGYWSSSPSSELQARFRTSSGSVALVDRRAPMKAALTHVVVSRRASDGLATVAVDGVSAAAGRLAGAMRELDGAVELAVGGTAAAGRPWRGAVHHLRVLKRPMTTSEAASRAQAGVPPDVVPPTPPGLLAHWTFDEGDGTVVHDRSGNGLHLAVVAGSDVAWTESGLRLVGPSRLSSIKTAEAIATAVGASGALTLTATVTPSAAVQGGPARVVSISADGLRRNLTLGQGAADGSPADRWDVRLRTSATDPNGIPSLTSPAATARADLTTLVFTRAPDGVTVLYIDGVEVARSVRAGDLLTWDRSFAVHVGDEAAGGRPWLGTVHEIAIWDRVLPPG